MKNKMVVIVLILVLAVVSFLIIRNRKLTKGEADKVYECPDFESKYAGKKAIKSSKSVDLEKTVTIGDYGKEVAYLQERLNTQYGASLDVDGKFGCDTHFVLLELTGLDGSEAIDLNDLK
jgi:hypothetical protein